MQIKQKCVLGAVSAALLVTVTAACGSDGGSVADPVQVPASQAGGAALEAGLSQGEVYDGSTNVFSGTVLSKKGSERLGGTPEVQYVVQTQQDFKGKAPRVAVVNVFATAVDHHDEPANVADPLEIGATYLLSARYLPEKRWFTVSAPGSIQPLSERSGRQSTPSVVPERGPNHQPPYTATADDEAQQPGAEQREGPAAEGEEPDVTSQTAE